MTTNDLLVLAAVVCGLASVVACTARYLPAAVALACVAVLCLALSAQIGA